MLFTLSSTKAEYDNWLKFPFHNHLKGGGAIKSITISKLTTYVLDKSRENKPTMSNKVAY